MRDVPQFITGVTTFIDGVGLLGTCKQVTLPKIEEMRETVSAGGFERAVGTGVFKQMEAEYTFTEYHRSVYEAMAKDMTGIAPSFVSKSSLKQRGKKIPIVATMKGGLDVDDGSYETGKEAERKVKQYVDYFSLEIAGKKEIELDIDNMIGYIFGVDYFEELRKHLL